MRAKLKDMRLHERWHGALALDESLPMIGRLLGCKRVETIARYTHLAEDLVKLSAVRISDSIATSDLIAKYSGFRRVGAPMTPTFQLPTRSLRVPRPIGSGSCGA